MSGKRVLVVARQDSIAVELVTRLTRAGFEVHVARTPVVAVQHLVALPDLAAVVMEHDDSMDRMVLDAMAGDRDLIAVPVVMISSDRELPAGAWAVTDPTAVIDAVDSVIRGSGEPVN